MPYGPLKIMSKKSLTTIDNHYPVLIVGGGIVGAGIFRDLSLHNIKTLIIDKCDFTSQTSQSSSKMLHGGIRYLENMDYKLIKEALEEKNLWLKLTPHLAQERRFYLPVYEDSLRPLWQIKIGLFLYDLLSLFRNTPHGQATKEECLTSFPELKGSELTGAGFYYDAVVDDARLTLECIYDGLLNQECHGLNYVSLTSVKYQDSLYHVTLGDELTKKSKTVTCEQLVFATGPFTDKLLGQLDYINWQPKLLPSKGSHLWLDRDAISITHPMVLTPKDGRVIFVIPNDEAILVGTTECDEEVSFNQVPSPNEIDYLLSNINSFFDKAQVSKEQIIGMFAGTRPLVKEPGASRGKTAREHQIYQPHSRTFVIIGGKYTTFRTMASELVSLLLRQRRQAYDPAKTLAPLRQESHITHKNSDQVTEEDLNIIIEQELVRKKEDIIHRRLGMLKLSDQLKSMIDRCNLP